jgi:tetratricopeptide (TPR) repeat protein
LPLVRSLVLLHAHEEAVAMQRTRIELHARDRADLSTLEALARALAALGETPVLTVTPEASRDAGGRLSLGPVPCDVRVMVVGRRAPVRDDAGRVVAILDEVGLDALPAPEAFGDADLVLVPGADARERLAGALPGDVAACGLARLDALRGADATVRAKARARLGARSDAALVACVASVRTPAGERARWTARLSSLAAEFATVVVARGAGPDGLDPVRAQAGRTLGLAALGERDGADALLGADVVVTDSLDAAVEAASLGRAVIRIVAGDAPARAIDVSTTLRAGDDLLPAVRASLRPPPARAPGAALERFLSADAAAPRMVAAILELVGPAEAIDDGLVFRDVEAQLAFGDRDGALARLQAHLAVRPSAEGFRRLSAVARRSERREVAASALERAEDLARSELARALCERARLEADGGKLDAARHAFEEARALDPDLDEAWVGLGSLALHGGDAATAEASFRRALDRRESARACSGLGLSLLASGRAGEALPPLERALDLDPESLPAVYGIVRAGFETADLGRAARRVATFVDLHPGNLHLAFTLAGIRYEIGDLHGAREMVERVALFDPAYDGLAALSAKLAVTA